MFRRANNAFKAKIAKQAQTEQNTKMQQLKNQDQLRDNIINRVIDHFEDKPDVGPNLIVEQKEAINQVKPASHSKWDQAFAGRQITGIQKQFEGQLANENLITAVSDKVIQAVKNGGIVENEQALLTNSNVPSAPSWSRLHANFERKSAQTRNTEREHIHDLAQQIALAPELVKYIPNESETLTKQKKF